MPPVNPPYPPQVKEAMRKSPLVGLDMIEYLRETFPMSVLRHSTDISEMYRVQGQQAVIDHLESLVNQQAKTALAPITVS